MTLDPFQHTTTCAVCGFARGIRGAQLACRCRGWVVLWRQLLYCVRCGANPCQCNADVRCPVSPTPRS